MGFGLDLVVGVVVCGVVVCGVVVCGVVVCGVVVCGVVVCGGVVCGVVVCGAVVCGGVVCGVVVCLWCGCLWCGCLWCGCLGWGCFWWGCSGMDWNCLGLRPEGGDLFKESKEGLYWKFFVVGFLGVCLVRTVEGRCCLKDNISFTHNFETNSKSHTKKPRNKSFPNKHLYTKSPSTPKKHPPPHQHQPSPTTTPHQQMEWRFSKTTWLRMSS